jgi:hypothetical protein
MTDHGERSFLFFYCGQDRNYELFAVLAGVARLTNDGFQPIVPCRGLPEDLSPAIRAAAENPDGLWGHNYSWLTLKELLDFPWQEKKRRYEGYVDAQQYYLFKAQGRPLQMFPGPEAFATAFDSGCSRKPLFGREQIVSNRKMDRYLKAGKGMQRKYTKIAFEIPYAEFCPLFLQETLPRLGTLGKPQDVRIVFWFDS